MRILSTLVLLLCSVLAYGQGPKPTPLGSPNSIIRIFGPTYADSVFGLPIIDITAPVNANIRKKGLIVMNRADSSIYFNTGTAWVKIGSSSGGGSISTISSPTGTLLVASNVDGSIYTIELNLNHPDTFTVQQVFGGNAVLGNASQSGKMVLHSAGTNFGFEYTAAGHPMKSTAALSLPDSAIKDTSYYCIANAGNGKQSPTAPNGGQWFNAFPTKLANVKVTRAAVTSTTDTLIKYPVTIEGSFSVHGDYNIYSWTSGSGNISVVFTDRRGVVHTIQVNGTNAATLSATFNSVTYYPLMNLNFDATYGTSIYVIATTNAGFSAEINAVLVQTSD